MKNAFLSIVFLCIHCVLGYAQSDLNLWFKKPAVEFEETFLLGNGKMGATIFGNTHEDKIFLNDITLWSGEPVKYERNQEAYKVIPIIREALAQKRYDIADKLQKEVQGAYSQSYMPMGTLKLTMQDNVGEVKNYVRTLSLQNAISNINYEMNGIKYAREYFVSYPDQVLVIRFTTDKKGTLNFDLAFESLLRYSVQTQNNLLKVEGYAPYHVEPNYRGAIPDSVCFDPDRGTRFAALYTVSYTDGRVINGVDRIGVRSASEAVVVVSVATSFNGFDKDPAKEGVDYMHNAQQQLNRARVKNYNKLKKSHLNDYQALFNRFSLRLNDGVKKNLPTDERLRAYAQGETDPGLETLYTQFGRYLLIASSRTPNVPANLQGLWNPYIRPPWSSNYTTNINVEENYWIAEVGNLSELHQPFFGLIEAQSRTGAQMAKQFLGVEKGWAACHNSDIWALTNPVGDYGEGNPQWANWYFGGVWEATHLWEHYQYTLDKDFLRNQAYPLMKGAVEFCLDWMLKDSNGDWITAPSTSPECCYRLPNGYVGATVYGATCDLAMMRELFNQTIEATKVLGIDASFRTELEERVRRFRPYQVGRNGSLLEWYHDFEYVEPTHRHTSHLFGLYPGTHITPVSTPKYADACKRTLEIRQDEATGWAMGWRINMWARLKEGNHAYKLLRRLLTYVPAGKAAYTDQSFGGTYPNLMDACPPFQIDGNFGAAAGVLEMLLQSHEGYIEILPALPDVWQSGEVKGIKARGNITVGIVWENMKAKKVTLLSPNATTVKIKINGSFQEIQKLQSNETKTIIIN